MDHLDAQQLAELETRLRELRDQLVGRRDPATAEASPTRGDRQDQAADEDRRSGFLLLARHDEKRLAEVEAALDRIERGTYGACEETGEPIPFARLQIEPTARFTVEAQELVERETDQDTQDSDAY